MWTEDAVLARYPSARWEPCDGLGSLQQYFDEQLKRAGFDLSFTNERFSDVNQWRNSVLPELRQAMALPDRSAAVHVRVLNHTQRDGYLHEEIEFASAVDRQPVSFLLIAISGVS